MAAIDTQPTPTRQGFLTGLAQGLARGLMNLTEANSRVRRVEQLQALSDEALAARGLRREDIVRHVFRDAFAL